MSDNRARVGDIEPQECGLRASRGLFAGPHRYNREEYMRVSIYNDGDHPIRVIADRDSRNETLIDTGEEVVVDAESMVHLFEIDHAKAHRPNDDDADEEPGEA
ncbi:hypothetical protein [Paraburkholderia tropica]|uniref:hypothetical protein n=1 Tax=Paraburkholderia tropica TaxID=92647 RepID=UPI0007EDB3A8|nr:hypothetical protein [Paraburkholderia tropica]OBR52896.1 hypothetical protein A6456_36635 [Paraburkholderia tropica]